MAEMYALHQTAWKDKHTVRCEDQVIEECGELLQAIIKRRRGKPNAIENLTGEILDVIFVLDTLTRNMGITQIQVQAGVNDIAQRVITKILGHQDDASLNKTKA